MVMSGTMFLIEQRRKGIVYRFFSISSELNFSMRIDAKGYPKECWDNYHAFVECFINSLGNGAKKDFWLTYKDCNDFVDWNNVIESDLKTRNMTGFDRQLISDFIDDFNLGQLTCR